MINIKNEILSCDISEIGAEIKSLKKNGEEYMWSGDPAFWAKTAPVLFPTIGATKDCKYIYGGKTYNMEAHGFLIGKEFVIENKTESSVTMLFKDTEETLEIYPFKFEFRAVFTVIGSSLRVEYRVKNLSDGDMYFSVGGHEAYATPGGVEDYDIIFPYNEDLNTILIEGPLVTDETLNVGKNTNFLPIYEKYFDLDTIFFRNLKSKEVLVKNRKTERFIKVEYPDCDFIAFWHEIGADFLCIEPWSALPDHVNNVEYDIRKREGITCLASDGEYSNTHIITI